MPAAEQMQMQMVDRLAAIVACVHNDPVTMIQLFFACNLRRRRHHMTDQRSIFSQRLRGGDNVLPGNNQKMCRRLGIDVGEADAAFVFVHAASRYGAGYDLAKQTVGRRSGRARFNLHNQKYFGCWPSDQGL